MKKILTILALSLLSFTASAATYDFSDEIKFGKSLEAQATKEGLDNAVFAKNFASYIEALSKKNIEFLASVVPADKRGTPEGRAISIKAFLDILKKDMGEKTLKEILDIK